MSCDNENGVITMYVVKSNHCWALNGKKCEFFSIRNDKNIWASVWCAESTQTLPLRSYRSQIGKWHLFEIASELFEFLCSSGADCVYVAVVRCWCMHIQLLAMCKIKGTHSWNLVAQMRNRTANILVLFGGDTSAATCAIVCEVSASMYVRRAFTNFPLLSVRQPQRRQ